MRPPAAGRGRRKGEKNKSTILREKLAEAVLLSEYQRKLTAVEILRRVADGDTSFTAEQVRAAEILAPFEMPKLQAVMHHTPKPPPPAAYELLRGAGLEAVEMLLEAWDYATGQASRQIEGRVEAEGGARMTTASLQWTVDPEDVKALLAAEFERNPLLLDEIFQVLAKNEVFRKPGAVFRYLFIVTTSEAAGAIHPIVGFRLRNAQERRLAIAALKHGMETNSTLHRDMPP